MTYGAGRSGPSIVAATTRLETMLGDTAVAVHPDDDATGTWSAARSSCRSPPAIPIVADALVDPEFGTGAVKVTPAHDPNDFEIGLRHGLPMIKMLDEEGHVHRHRHRVRRHGPLRGPVAVRERLASRAGSWRRSGRPCMVGRTDARRDSDGAALVGAVVRLGETLVGARRRRVRAAGWGPSRRRVRRVI